MVSEELRLMAALKGRSPNGEALVADLFVPKFSVISAISVIRG
jgi:hypothetical protein